MQSVRPSRRTVMSMGLLALSSAALRPARADDFPTRAIRVVVPFAAGNTFDVALRQMSEEIVKAGGKPLVIDNKPGASGIIAAQTVATAAPDGYTILLASLSHLAVNPFTFSKLPYDVERDYRPISGLLGATLLMVVNAEQVPATRYADFVTWAKARPGKVFYASFSAGNTSHFAGVILNKAAGLEMVHVPYSGTPPAVQSVLAGDTQVAFVPRAAVRQHIETGRLRALATTSSARIAQLPDVPTFRELGQPELEILLWSALLAPAATPDDVVQRLNRIVVDALGTQPVREKFASMEFDPLPSTPEAFTRQLHAEQKRWSEAVRLSGFKASE
ncbi:MAG: Bug family tripartite tricarboxylate transporter substrate binding protein [Lautropia sp.]